MLAAASVVVAVGTATGMMSAVGDGRGADEARPAVTASPRLEPPPVVPSPSFPPASSRSATKPASPTAGPREKASAKASASGAGTERRAAPVSTRLYRHPASQVLDWVRAHPDDPRRAVIESRTADRPAAVWFADHSPDSITSRVRAVASGGAAQGRVPVLVPCSTPSTARRASAR